MNSHAFMRAASACAAVLAALVLVAACDRPGRGSEPAAPALPDLAGVGGVQDVWPFPFGFDADRGVVEEAFGPPARVDFPELPRTQAGGTDVVRWHYPGLVFTFLLRSGGAPAESLMAVRIENSDVQVRSGLRIGMSRQEALDLLGDPQIESDGSLVYFFAASTIELEFSDGLLGAVVLARAMP